MKNLVLSISSLLLLAIQVNAKQGSITVNSSTSAATTSTVSVSTNSSHKSYSKVSVNTQANSSVNAQDQDADDSMKTKSFSKSFSVDKNDKVNLSNQYGEMVIKIWDKNEVKVDVEIKAYSKSESDAQKLLDEVSISSSKTGDLITVKTNMEDRNGRYGSSTKNGKVIWRREVKVNYVVYMPSTNALSLSNTYGSVNMGNLSGALYAKVQYGGFLAANLSNTNNYISVQYGDINVQELNKAVVKQQYGKAVTIGTVGTLDLDVQYAAANITTIKGNAVIKKQYGNALVIGSVDNLDLDAQYTNVNVTNVNGNATVKQQYNKLSLGSVGKLKLDGQYVGATIGTLRGDGAFDMEYNNLTIGNISPGCKVLTVKSQYVDLSLGFADSYNAIFEMIKTYGSFKYGSNVTSRTVSDEDQTKRYNGKIGSGGTSTVKINAEYGTVLFK